MLLLVPIEIVKRLAVCIQSTYESVVLNDVRGAG